MAKDRIVDKKRCPTCGAWIELPFSRQRAFFEKHIKTEHPEAWARQQVTRNELLGAEVYA